MPIKRLIVIAFLLPFIPFSHALSIPQMLNYLEWQNSENVIFMLNTESPATISEIRMSFLSGEDCYSGYQQNIRVYGLDTPFIVKPNQPFTLNATSIYLAAQTVLDPTTLTNTQAILIRFVDTDHGQRYQQFAWFNGSCHDQDINCCIPVTCSEETKTCTPKYNMGLQFVTWE